MLFNPAIQLALALTCVAAAVAFLLLRGWRWWRGRSAGCGTCTNNSQPIVTLDISPGLGAKAKKRNEGPAGK